MRGKLRLCGSTRIECSCSRLRLLKRAGISEGGQSKEDGSGKEGMRLRELHLEILTRITKDWIAELRAN